MPARDQRLCQDTPSCDGNRGRRQRRRKKKRLVALAFRAESLKDSGLHKPYTSVIEHGVEKRIYKEFPTDEEIKALTYATELRELAVYDRRLFNRPAYLPPELLQDYDPNWQRQCSTTEHAILWGETHSDG